MGCIGIVGTEGKVERGVGAIELGEGQGVGGGSVDAGPGGEVSVAN